MQLRTFIAGDMRSALAQMREEMGPDAIIVSSQRAKEGGVLVRAALDEAEADLEAAVDATAPPQREDAAVADFETGYRDNLIRRLRTAGAAPAQSSRHFNRAELIAILRSHRAPGTACHALAETAEKTGLSDMTLALASALDKKMRCEPLDLATAPALLLIGPHGAGKTATAAKIAAHARMAGREVKLIAADAAGAGAVARLEAFANHLGVRFLVADGAETVANAVLECGLEKSFAIVDTAGFDPRNGRARTAFAALAQIADLEAIGIVSACGDSEETADIAAALTLLGARRLVVTGLDLARRLGALLAASTQDLNLAHVTRSPYVAGGLETLTPLSLARALIESGGDADRGSAQ
jgi:flagellar biosynthesis protein FlhF